jgi:hypothetical protein
MFSFFSPVVHNLFPFFSRLSEKDAGNRKFIAQPEKKRRKRKELAGEA